MSRAQHPRQTGGANCGTQYCRILRVLWRQQWVEDFRYVALVELDDAAALHGEKIGDLVGIAIGEHAGGA